MPSQWQTYLRGRAKSLVIYPPGGIPPRCAHCAIDSLLVLNGKGSGSYPNPDGPSPFRWPVKDKTTKMEYVAAIQTGTASVIDAFALQKELDEYTHTVIANSP